MKIDFTGAVAPPLFFSFALKTIKNKKREKA